MSGTPALSMTEIPLTCEDLRRRFLAAFCPALSPSLKSPDYKPVLWSVFSSEKVPALCGGAARAAFSAQNPQKLYAFYEYDGDEENGLQLILESPPCAEDFADENDLYLMPPDFSWAYVQTHEDGFGPYFCRREARPL